MYILLTIVAALGIVAVGGYGAYRLGRWGLQRTLVARAVHAERLARSLARDLDDERLLNTRLDAGRPYGLGPDMFADVAATIAISAAPAAVTVWEFGGGDGQTGQWQLPRHIRDHAGARHQLAGRHAQMAQAA